MLLVINLIIIKLIFLLIMIINRQPHHERHPHHPHPPPPHHDQGNQLNPRFSCARCIAIVQRSFEFAMAATITDLVRLVGNGFLQGNFATQIVWEFEGHERYVCYSGYFGGFRLIKETMFLRVMGSKSKQVLGKPTTNNQQIWNETERKHKNALQVNWDSFWLKETASILKLLVDDRNIIFFSPWLKRWHDTKMFQLHGLFSLDFLEKKPWGTFHPFLVSGRKHPLSRHVTLRWLKARSKMWGIWLVTKRWLVWNTQHLGEFEKKSPTWIFVEINGESPSSTKSFLRWRHVTSL